MEDKLVLVANVYEVKAAITSNQVAEPRRKHSIISMLASAHTLRRKSKLFHSKKITQKYSELMNRLSN